jgi:hypothetical protein
MPLDECNEFDKTFRDDEKADSPLMTEVDSTLMTVVEKLKFLGRPTDLSFSGKWISA